MPSSPPVEASRRPTTSRFFLPVLAALALLLGLLTVAPAQAAGPFTISGTVTGEGVGPVEGALVELQKFDTQDQYYITDDNVYTEADGGYTFPAVQAGAKYRLRVKADGFVRKSSAEFVLAANKSVDFQVLTGGSISGTTVEDGAPTTPVAEEFVFAYPVVGGVVDRDGYTVTNSAEDGSFRVDGLATGSYKLEFRDGYDVHVTEFYDNVSTLDDAKLVTVTKDVDQPLGAIGLAVGGVVTGHLVDDADGPVVNPEVTALRVLGNGEADYENAYRGTVDQNGVYTVRGLPTGYYKISFSERSDTYFDQFYNGKTTVEAAEGVAVVQGADPTDLKTTKLERRGKVTGTVMKSATAPFYDALVEAFPVVNGVVSTESADYAYTESDGTFTMKQLHAGTYQLTYRDGLHAYLDQTGEQFTIETGGTFGAKTVTMVKKPVKKSATVKVTAAGGKKKATFTVKVTATGVTPTGKVTVKLGSKTLKTATLSGGKATVTVTGQAKGKRSYTVVYGGDTKVATKTVTTSKVTIT